MGMWWLSVRFSLLVFGNLEKVIVLRVVSFKLSTGSSGGGVGEQK